MRRPLEAVPIAGLTLLAFLGMRQSRRSLTIPQRAALLIPLATFRLVYYLVGYSARYVFPLHGVLLVLAGAWIGQSIGGRDAARGGRRPVSGGPTSAPPSP